MADPGRAGELRLLGIRVHPLGIEELNRRIAAAIEGSRRLLLGHQNLHGVYLAHHDDGMRRFGERADLVQIDGMSLIVLARLLGHELAGTARVTYADWIWSLAEQAALRGWRLFYLGSRQGVAAKGASLLAGRYPGLSIETHHGYFDATPGGSENESVLSRIGASRPHLLLVGMGMPRQERWVLGNLDRIGAGVILTAGACMDYVAGEVPTPPRWAGRVGLEWLFRLVAEPRRLGRRYLVEPWFVLGLLAREIAGGGEKGSG